MFRPRVKDRSKAQLRRLPRILTFDAVLWFAAASGFIYLGGAGVRTGFYWTRRSTLYRADEPVAFWVATAMDAAFVFFCLFMSFRSARYAISRNYPKDARL